MLGGLDCFLLRCDSAFLRRIFPKRKDKHYCAQNCPFDAGAYLLIGKGNLVRLCHACKPRREIFRGFQFFQSQFLAFKHCIWRFAAIDGNIEFSVSPFCEHRIEFSSRVFAGLLAFQDAPIDLIQFGNHLGFNVQFLKGATVWCVRLSALTKIC